VDDRVLTVAERVGLPAAALTNTSTVMETVRNQWS
jgi:hypothetical protein